MSSTNKAPGRVGRPSQSGRPKGGREQFLDAAVVLLARKGSAASTMAEIAAEVGVTPAMANYYFQKKDQLLDAVVNERIEPFIAQVFEDVAAQLEAEQPFGVVVQTLVHNIVDGVGNFPWMPSLWSGEILAGTGHLRDRVLAVVFTRYLPGFRAGFIRAQKIGLIPSGMHPRLTMLSILGTCMLPFALSGVSGMDPQDENCRQMVIQHALTLFGGAIHS